MFTFDAERVSNWVTEKAGGSYTHLCTAIGLEKDNQLIAGIMYDGYTQASITMSSRVDYPTKVNRRFYWMIFDYPFNQLKVKVIHVIVNENNHKAIKVNEHLGFKREAILRDYFLDGDAIIYAMRKDDCRFIKGKYVQSI